MRNPHRFNKWIQRGLDHLIGTDKNLVVGGSRLLGAPHLLNCYLLTNEKTIDIELAPMFTVHEEFLVSVFAQAVNEALGWRALPAAVSLDYQVRLLAQRLPDLDEYTIIIRNADFGRLLIEELQTLRHTPRLILEATTPGLVNVKRALHLDPTELLLRSEEAAEIANSWGGRAARDWRRVYSLSGGQYQLFLDHLPHQEGFMPEFWEAPTPDRTFDPELVLDVLMQRGRWADALEVAANDPELLERLLREGIGPQCAEEGILAYLKLHLDSLPEPYRSSELALEWRLIGAIKDRTDDLPDVLERAAKHLESHEAPSLRGRYGSVIGGESGLVEARRALAASRTPTILYQVATLTADEVEAVELLREAVTLARETGNHHEFVRGARQLARRLADRGEFIEAADLVAQALAIIDERGLKNGALRRGLIFDLASYRWLTGKSVGVRELVRIEAEALGPGQERIGFWVLLAAMAAAHDDGSAGDDKIRAMTEVESAGNPAVSALHRVRQMLRRDDKWGALRVAATALASAGDDPDLRVRALLASALAHAAGDRELATKALRDADKLLGPGFSLLRLYLELLLARVTGSRVRDEYRHLFKQVPYETLRVLGGDGREYFDIYRDLLDAEGVMLAIDAFGRGELVVDGQPVRLTKQMMETLLVLALNPGGLSPDELQARLSPTMSSSHVKVVVSRLRKHVPITRGPYRLDCCYVLSLDLVREALSEGRLVRALELASGRVLPWSDAVQVRSVRAEIEAELRVAVLDSSDPEVIAAALETMQYDPVVQQHARRMLKEHDARRHAPLAPGQPTRVALEAW